MVPATMACTAMGISGVPVTPLVAVLTGDGVMTGDVAVAVACSEAAGAADVAD